MKIAIVYDSKTKNTETLALTLADLFKSENVVYVGMPKEGIDADFYWIGSWTDKGNCSESICHFLEGLQGRSLAYFQTAGFGGSPSYYDTLYERVCSHIDPSNKVYGHFFCQGKMPLALRSRYESLLKENPEDKKLQVSIENFDQARSHPDQKDLDDLCSWAQEIMNKVKDPDC